MKMKKMLAVLIAFSMLMSFGTMFTFTVSADKDVFETVLGFEDFGLEADVYVAFDDGSGDEYTVTLDENTADEQDLVAFQAADTDNYWEEFIDGDKGFLVGIDLVEILEDGTLSYADFSGSGECVQIVHTNEAFKVANGFDLSGDDTLEEDVQVVYICQDGCLDSGHAGKEAPLVDDLFIIPLVDGEEATIVVSELGGDKLVTIVIENELNYDIEDVELVGVTLFEGASGEVVAAEGVYDGDMLYAASKSVAYFDAGFNDVDQFYFVAAVDDELDVTFEFDTDIVEYQVNLETEVPVGGVSVEVEDLEDEDVVKFFFGNGREISFVVCQEAYVTIVEDISVAQTDDYEITVSEGADSETYDRSDLASLVSGGLGIFVPIGSTVEAEGTTPDRVGSFVFDPALTGVGDDEFEVGEYTLTISFTDELVVNTPVTVTYEWSPTTPGTALHLPGGNDDVTYVAGAFNSANGVAAILEFAGLELDEDFKNVTEAKVTFDITGFSSSRWLYVWSDLTGDDTAEQTFVTDTAKAARSANIDGTNAAAVEITIPVAFLYDSGSGTFATKLYVLGTQQGGTWGSNFRSDVTAALLGAELEVTGEAADVAPLPVEIVEIELDGTTVVDAKAQGYFTGPVAYGEVGDGEYEIYVADDGILEFDFEFSKNIVSYAIDGGTDVTVGADSVDDVAIADGEKIVFDFGDGEELEFLVKVLAFVEIIVDGATADDDYTINGLDKAALASTVNGVGGGFYFSAGFDLGDAVTATADAGRVVDVVIVPDDSKNALVIDEYKLTITFDDEPVDPVDAFEAAFMSEFVDFELGVDVDVQAGNDFTVTLGNNDVDVQNFFGLVGAQQMIEKVVENNSYAFIFDLEAVLASQGCDIGDDFDVELTVGTSPVEAFDEDDDLTRFVVYLAEGENATITAEWGFGLTAAELEFEIVNGLVYPFVSDDLADYLDGDGDIDVDELKTDSGARTILLSAAAFGEITDDVTVKVDGFEYVIVFDVTNGINPQGFNLDFAVQSLIGNGFGVTVIPAQSGEFGFTVSFEIDTGEASRQDADGLFLFVSVDGVYTDVSELIVDVVDGVVTIEITDGYAYALTEMDLIPGDVTGIEVDEVTAEIHADDNRKGPVAYEALPAGNPYADYELMVGAEEIVDAVFTFNKVVDSVYIANGDIDDLDNLAYDVTDSVTTAGNVATIADLGTHSFVKFTLANGDEIVVNAFVTAFVEVVVVDADADAGDKVELGGSTKASDWDVTDWNDVDNAGWGRFFEVGVERGDVISTTDGTGRTSVAVWADEDEVGFGPQLAAGAYKITVTFDDVAVDDCDATGGVIDAPTGRATNRNFDNGNADDGTNTDRSAVRFSVTDELNSDGDVSLVGLLSDTCIDPSEVFGFGAKVNADNNGTTLQVRFRTDIRTDRSATTSWVNSPDIRLSNQDGAWIRVERADPAGQNGNFDFWWINGRNAYSNGSGTNVAPTSFVDDQFDGIFRGEVMFITSSAQAPYDADGKNTLLEVSLLGYDENANGEVKCPNPIYLVNGCAAGGKSCDETCKNVVVLGTATYNLATETWEAFEANCEHSEVEPIELGIASIKVGAATAVNRNALGFHRGPASYMAVGEGFELYVALEDVTEGNEFPEMIFSFTEDVLDYQIGEYTPSGLVIGADELTDGVSGKTVTFGEGDIDDLAVIKFNFGENESIVIHVMQSAFIELDITGLNADEDFIVEFETAAFDRDDLAHIIDPAAIGAGLWADVGSDIPAIDTVVGVDRRVVGNLATAFGNDTVLASKSYKVILVFEDDVASLVGMERNEDEVPFRTATNRVGPVAYIELNPVGDAAGQKFEVMVGADEIGEFVFSFDTAVTGVSVADGAVEDHTALDYDEVRDITVSDDDKSVVITDLENLDFVKFEFENGDEIIIHVYLSVFVEVVVTGNANGDSITIGDWDAATSLEVGTTAGWGRFFDIGTAADGLVTATAAVGRKVVVTDDLDDELEAGAYLVEIAFAACVHDFGENPVCGTDCVNDCGVKSECGECGCVDCFPPNGLCGDPLCPVCYPGGFCQYCAKDGNVAFATVKSDAFVNLPASEHYADAETNFDARSHLLKVVGFDLSEMADEIDTVTVSVNFSENPGLYASGDANQYSMWTWTDLSAGFGESGSRIDFLILSEAANPKNAVHTRTVPFNANSVTVTLPKHLLVQGEGEDAVFASAIYFAGYENSSTVALTSRSRFQNGLLAKFGSVSLNGLGKVPGDGCEMCCENPFCCYDCCGYANGYGKCEVPAGFCGCEFCGGVCADCSCECFCETEPETLTLTPAAGAARYSGTPARIVELDLDFDGEILVGDVEITISPNLADSRWMWAWTDLTGADDYDLFVGLRAGSENRNIDPNKLVRWGVDSENTDRATITVPVSMFYNAATGEVATKLYLLGTQKTDAEFIAPTNNTSSSGAYRMDVTDALTGVSVKANVQEVPCSPCFNHGIRCNSGCDPEECAYWSDSALAPYLNNDGDIDLAALIAEHDAATIVLTKSAIEEIENDITVILPDGGEYVIVAGSINLANVSNNGFVLNATVEIDEDGNVNITTSHKGNFGFDIQFTFEDLELDLDNLNLFWFNGTNDVIVVGASVEDDVVTVTINRGSIYRLTDVACTVDHTDVTKLVRENGLCTDILVCPTCAWELEDSEGNHTPSTADCTKCSDCGLPAGTTIPGAAHVFECDTTCENCTTANPTPGHTPSAADCTVCDVCDETIPGAMHDNPSGTTCVTGFECGKCDFVQAPGECEALADNCRLCRVCGAAMAAQHEFPANCTATTCLNCTFTRAAGTHAWPVDCTGTDCTVEGCDGTRDAGTHTFPRNCTATACTETDCPGTREAGTHDFGEEPEDGDPCLNANCDVTYTPDGDDCGDCGECGCEVCFPPNGLCGDMYCNACYACEEGEGDTKCFKFNCEFCNPENQWFALGSIRGEFKPDGTPDIGIFDALEILKFIVGMNNVIENGNENISSEEARRVASLGTSGRESGNPDIFCVLEVLKYIVGMNSVVDGETMAFPLTEED